MERIHVIMVKYHKFYKSEVKNQYESLFLFYRKTLSNSSKWGDSAGVHPGKPMGMLEAVQNLMNVLTNGEHVIASNGYYTSC